MIFQLLARLEEEQQYFFLGFRCLGRVFPALFLERWMLSAQPVLFVCLVWLFIYLCLITHNLGGTTQVGGGVGVEQSECIIA